MAIVAENSSNDLHVYTCTINLKYSLMFPDNG